MAERGESGPAASGPVLLTGATGFVGVRLQHSLRARGYAVRALLRPGSARSSRVLPGCESVVVDLDDAPALQAAVADVAAVIYCAGSVRGRRPDDFRPANVAGVRRVAAALMAQGGRVPLLLVSSLAATRPDVSDYALTKREGERALADFAGLHWTVLRPPALYGPGDVEMRPVLALLRHAVAPLTGPRGQRISLLHVDDFATAVLAWLEDPARCNRRTFELHDGTPGGYDWPALGRAVAGREPLLLPVPALLLRTAATINWLLSFVFRYAPMLTPGKARELRQDAWVASNGEFQAVTGWAPTIRLAQGAAQLFAPTKSG